MNVATQVFNIPELMELILLSLPDSNSIHDEIKTMRTIHLSQATCRTWYDLVRQSATLKQVLYLSAPLDIVQSAAWNEKTAFPPARPNPWIPHLLLNQRSWGSAWPFETTYTMSLNDNPGPSKPKLWTFYLEISRAQFSRLPAPGEWRKQLATSPPFTDFWYTRSFYELGSGRAPFCTHIDYDAKKPKVDQKYRVHCEKGVTLGDLVDAFCELFERHPAAKFVMTESVREAPVDERGQVKLADDRPTTKAYMPGMSAERSLQWQY